MMRIGDEVVSLDGGKLFTSAQSAMENNNLEEAAALLKQFLQLYPKSAAAHYKYGFVLLQKERMQKH